ncbi:MAG TPA: DUF4159 domain-containing protein, partial [Gammaproteobacteria bacterium]|nr:DUF4159 domain-containing protein [Gammaproteobacteria bacterium]
TTDVPPPRAPSLPSSSALLLVALLGLAAPAGAQWYSPECHYAGQALMDAGPPEPQAEFQMARLIYADAYGRIQGGWRPWWAIDWPEAECHITRGIERLTRLDIAHDSFRTRAVDPRLFDYPWLFVQQVGHWYLSEEEASQLREYLRRGGFLVVDDFHGEYDWAAFVESMYRVLPGAVIVDVPETDPLLHILYDLDQRTQIPGRRHLYRAPDGRIEAQLQGPQRWRGIYDDAGRLMVAINFNMDMGDAWEHADDPVYPEPMTALAYRFAINYIVYAMTH